jgi:membrane protease YdiL (CAAX protease family)
MARVSFPARAREIGVALLWLALFAIVGLTVTIGLSGLVPGVGGRMWWMARNGAYQLAGFLGATWLVGRLANRYSWDRMGWRPPRALPRYFLRGLALGVAMAALAVLLAVVTDGAELRLTGGSDFLEVAAPLAVGLCTAALAEELMWRGYPLRRLAEAIGPAAATVVLAVGFGAAHLSNPGTGLLSTVNIALAGVWLGVAFFSRGGMALAWGLHLGWNAGLSLVFDAPVSGLAFDVPGVDYTPGAHAWLDGGRFGPEGGVIGTVVFLAGMLLLLGPRLRRPGRGPWPAEAAA